MHRFRRKSDARRSELPASTAHSIASSPRHQPPFPIVTQHVQVHPPPELPSLPPESDFRTSLIFPDLARRFTLLRASSGVLYSLDDLRSRFAEQRAKGAQNQISEEEEDMLLNMLSRIRAHGAGIGNKPTKTAAPDELTSAGVRSEPSSSSISSNDAGSSTSSTVRQSTQSSMTVSSGSGSDPSFSPVSPTSHSSKRHSNNLFSGNQLRDIRYMRKSSNRTISSSRSALSSTQSESTAENVANALIDSYSEGHVRPVTPDGSTPTASPSSSPISSALYRPRNLSNSSNTDDGLGALPAPLALRHSRQLTNIQIERMSMSLEEAIKRIEDVKVEEEADDQVLVPRTPQQNGNAVVDESGRAMAVTTDDTNASPPRPISDAAKQSSTMTWLADVDTSGPTGVYRSPSPYRAGPSTSPVPRVPGYIPGMPRPVTPHRDMDLEDVRSLSITPRAASSSVTQDRTTSPTFSSPTSSLLRQSVNTSPTPYGARPKSPHSSVRDRHGNPRSGSELASLNSHWRRPSSPLSSNSTAFQSLNGGSRPSTPSTVTWNVPARESTQSYRPLGRNGTLLGHSRSASDTSVGEVQPKAESPHDETSQNILQSPRPIYSPSTTDDGRSSEARPKFLSNGSVLSTSALAFIDYDPTSELSSYRSSASSPPQDQEQPALVASIPDEKTRSEESVVSPLLTPPMSPFGHKFSNNSLLIPLTSNSSSRSSLVSIGSSYHSMEDDGARFVYAPERAEPAWHDVPTFRGHGSRSGINSLVPEDPGQILRQYTGLTKLDLLTIQSRLVEAAEIRVRTSEVRAPSTLRRRRPSTAQSVQSIGGQPSRTTSPAPVSGLPYTSNADNNVKTNTLLDTVVDNMEAPEPVEHGRDTSDDTAVQVVPPAPPFLAPIPTSSPGRRNKDLAEILFGPSEMAPAPSPSEPEPEPTSPDEVIENDEEQEKLEVSHHSPAPSKNDDNVHPAPDHDVDFVSDNAHVADTNDLIRQVQERTEAAMAQLRRSPQQGRFPISGTHATKKRINLQDISAPLLVQSSTSIDKIPTIPTSPMNPAHNEPQQRTIKMSFSRRLRNTLRAKNGHPNGDEVTPWTLDNTPSSITSSPQVGNRSLTPSKGSTTDLHAQPKAPNVSPPASAGPNLKSFMSRFRKKGQPMNPMEHEHKNSSSLAMSSNALSLSAPTNGRRSFQLAPSAAPLLSRSGSVSQAVARDVPTAPSMSRQPTETPTITASSCYPASSPPEPAALKQFFEAAQNLGLDQSALNEFLTRSQSSVRRGTDTSARPNREDLSARDHTEFPARASSPVIPDVFIERPVADLSRNTSVRQQAASPLPAAPRRVREIADGHGNVRGTIVRRTLIFPSSNGSTTDLSGLPRKAITKGYKRASNLSVQSNRSVAERIPTPPPSKAKRQSIEPSPPVPTLPSPLSFSNSGRFSSSRLTLETPVEKSPYDSFYDMYTGDRTASAQSPELYEPPKTPLDESLPEMEEGQALEVIELANGETIWSIVNGLRAEDAESYYPRRSSLDSEYSNLPTHDSESEQLFFKEHVRTGSKDSNISTYARRKSRVAAGRPETKVFHSSSGQIGRLIEQLARNTEAATFNIKPKASHVPGHSHSGSLQTESDVNWTVEERLDRMLASVNPSR